MLVNAHKCIYLRLMDNSFIFSTLRFYSSTLCLSVCCFRGQSPGEQDRTDTFLSAIIRRASTKVHKNRMIGLKGATFPVHAASDNTQ